MVSPVLPYHINYYFSLMTTNHKKKKKQEVPTKYWCYTINNPTEVDIVSNDLFTYHVYGIEVGEEGTKHFQGFCIFKKVKRLTAVKKVFPRAHLERMKSTPKKSAAYCMKDGDYKEHGIITLTASERMAERWQDAIELARQNKIDDILPDLQARYYHAWKRMAQDHPQTPETNPTTCGIWYVGPTGSGKSKAVREEYTDIYDKPLNKWWDGYQNQSTVLLEDVDDSHASWIGYYLKRWSDHYPFPAEQKGTTIQIRPKQLVVTSQQTIDEIFPMAPKTSAALKRRFRVTHFTNSITNDRDMPAHLFGPQTQV